MNISSKKVICQSLGLYALLTIVLIPVSALCDNPQSHPSFSSYDKAVRWYLETGKLDWMYPLSTAIHKAAYHKEDKVMIIYFTSNFQKGYIFGEVPKGIWEEFKNAPSKGRFYNTRIKQKFGFKLGANHK